MVTTVENPTPHTTTVASGRWTSAPALVANAMGKEPKGSDGTRGQDRAHRMGAALDDRFAELVAVLVAVQRTSVELAAHGRCQHHAVEHRDAGQRDKPHRGRNAKRQATQQQPNEPSGGHERHHGKHAERVAKVAEDRDKHRKHDRKCHRQDEREPPAGSLEVLKLPTPLDGVARVEWGGVVDRSLRFADPRDEVAAAQVHLDAKRAATIFATDLRGAFGFLDVCDLRQRDERAVARRHNKVPNRFGCRSFRRRQQPQLESARALKHGANLNADACGLDGVQRCGHRHAVPCHLGAIGAHDELGQPQLPLDADVPCAVDRRNGRGDLFAHVAQGRKRSAVHHDLHVGSGSADQLGGPVFDGLRDAGKRPGRCGFDGVFERLSEAVEVGGGRPFVFGPQPDEDVRVVLADGVGGDLGPAGHRQRAFDFGKLQQRGLGGAIELLRLG